MRLTLQNHIVCADYGQVHLDARVVGQIINYTAETWQPDRPKKERECNIEQGKIAEEITERFIRQYYSQELSLKTYDEIRNDDFKKHAPFDFLLWKTGTVNIAFIEEAIRQDIARTPNKFVKLSNVTRRLCRTLGVKIVEVKSTNIRNDLKVESDFTGDYDNVKSVQKLLETIRRKDDVFCYPKLKRRESDPGYCLDDYCREVQERFSEFDGCKGENLRHRVIAWECENQCCDIFVRVYLDRPAKKGFVIGWMQKEELLDDTVQFKRMRQKNKSELVWICFLRRCQGKRSRCIGKKTSGDYTEIKILCLKINRQMQTKNTRSSVRTGRECVRKTDIFTGSCGKGLSRQRKKVL